MIEEKAVRMRGISDLSMSEIHAIDAIGVGEGKMMSEVAEELHITMGTLTATMTKLEKKGYAKSTPLFLRKCKLNYPFLFFIISSDTFLGTS